MKSARAERTQTKNCIMGLHPVSSEFVNGLIDQGVALSELVGIDPSNIGIVFSATRKAGGTIADPKSVRGTYHMPQVQSPGMNVPAILQLKFSVSVTEAL